MSKVRRLINQTEIEHWLEFSIGRKRSQVYIFQRETCIPGPFFHGGGGVLPRSICLEYGGGGYAIYPQEEFYGVYNIVFQTYQKFIFDGRRLRFSQLALKQHDFIYVHMNSNV